MFETFFLLILLDGTVTVKPKYESMFVINPIPAQTVKECAEYSGVDPYNREHMGDMMRELDLLDCFYYDVGDHEHNIYAQQS